MLKPEQVPKEVVDAFWQHFQDNKSTDGAIAAALSAWPGARERLVPSMVSGDRHCLILPLTEASDDQ
jgi:hypothetical protein